MSFEYQIREAKPADASGIVTLFGILDDLHTAGAPHQFRGSSAVPRSEQLVLDLMNAADSAVLVAEVDSRVVGVLFVKLEATPDRMPFVPRRFAQIHDLVVAPEARGHGIGRALVRAAEDWALSRGVDAVELTVWEFNDAARRMYDQLGYTTQHRRLRRVLPGEGR